MVHLARQVAMDGKLVADGVAATKQVLEKSSFATSLLSVVLFVSH